MRIKTTIFLRMGNAALLLCFSTRKKKKKKKKVSIRNRYRRIYFCNYFRQIRLTVRVYSFDPFKEQDLLERNVSVKYLVSQYLREAWMSWSRLKEELAGSRFLTEVEGNSV